MRARHRHLLAVPCVALLSFAAACGSPGSASPRASDHSTTSARAPKVPPPPPPPNPPTSSLATLKRVKWTSVLVPGDVCPGGSGQVALSHRKATVPAPSGVHAPTGLSVTASAPVFGDLYGAGHDVAAMNVWCTGAHGSAASQLEDSWVLFTYAGAKTHAIATLQPTQPAFARKGVHVPYFDDSPSAIAIAPKTVTVHELWYTSKDSTCCPSEHATTVWRAHGTSFSSYTKYGT